MNDWGQNLTRLATLSRRLRVPVLLMVFLAGVVLTLLTARQAQEANDALVAQWTTRSAKRGEKRAGEAANTEERGAVENKTSRGDARGRPPMTTTTRATPRPRSTPMGRYLARRPSHRPMWIIVIGLMLTLLVSAILGGLILYTDRMETFAADRENVNEQLRRRIAEREEAEQALAAANEELRHVNTDMERFVGAVSHDLKSPLVAAEMLVNVLESAVKKNDEDKTRVTAAQIAHACRRMRRIIDDLLEHQRAGFSHLNVTEVDLCELALSVVEERREQVAEQHAHLDVDPNLPTIRGDRGRLFAMWDNLIVNALKYGRPTDTAVAQRVEVGCRVTGDELRLFVRDNGPGIPEAQRECIWELFQRLAGDDEGTGIGLAIIQRVAQTHGGRAWIECPALPAEGDEPGGGGNSAGNRIDCGTTFWIALPRERMVAPV